MITILGQTIDFPSASAGSDAEHFELRHCSSGAIVVGDMGRIVWCGTKRDLPSEFRAVPKKDYGKQLILPGFVDAHLHYAQYRMLAAHGRDLLEWLTRFTFPEEVRYSDFSVAVNAAKHFLHQLFRNGTTSCLVFSTTHTSSVKALFELAEGCNMSLATGKTWMDREGPDGLLESSEISYRESKTLMASWHQRGRLQYALSPRFAVTSTREQLEAVGSLLVEYPNMLLQTHLSESLKEIEVVKAAYPDAQDYTDVYDRFGLLRKGSLFAHGIHLSERELARLSESQSAIVHCPTSNGFLGSGLFRWHHTKTSPRSVAVGLGSDIGAGTSYSMLQTMREAFVVSRLLGQPIDPVELFYTSTLGNARLLGWDKDLGSIEVGKFADLVVLDPEATDLLSQRNGLSESIVDQLFALMILGDDRAITETFVSGKPRKHIVFP